MAKLSDLSDEEREKRIAELKQKMQRSARKVQGEAAAAEAAAEAAPAEKPAAPAQEAAPAAAAEAAPPAVAVVEAQAEAPAETKPAVTAAPGAGNGAAPVAAKPVARVKPKPEPAAEPAAAAPSKEQMNRREFLVYSLAAGLGVLGLGTGVLMFQYMYPRFREGEFGGVFRIPEGELPGTDAPPVGYVDGKFWLVNTADTGPKAIYMVCTHLGCLYKWVGENNRFECPCHGSKFTREGLYIEGPAPRSLDSFETTVENGEIMVATGSKINGAPASESPAAGTG